LTTGQTRPARSQSAGGPGG